jgi:hypothetical protein
VVDIQGTAWRHGRSATLAVDWGRRQGNEGSYVILRVHAANFLWSLGPSA